MLDLLDVDEQVFEDTVYALTEHGVSFDDAVDMTVDALSIRGVSL
jgi:hypothetical protein